MAEVKTYELVGGKNNGAVFTGRSPRQAALKAASRGEASITLRERGAYRSETVRDKKGKKKSQRLARTHKFKGGRKKVRKPEGAPEWLPEQVWQPWVKKSGVEWVKA
ncbi:MAG TPA: non-histone chromosomal MC1 family protein [archaeon]|nr:non-histone chromosomal MC1 family protein [archaeon]